MKKIILASIAVALSVPLAPVASATPGWIHPMFCEGSASKCGPSYEGPSYSGPSYSGPSYSGPSYSGPSYDG